MEIKEEELNELYRFFQNVSLPRSSTNSCVKVIEGIVKRENERVQSESKSTK